jgi:hypothetical protein
MSAYTDLRDIVRTQLEAGTGAGEGNPSRGREMIAAAGGSWRKAAAMAHPDLNPDADADDFKHVIAARDADGLWITDVSWRDETTQGPPDRVRAVRRRRGAVSRAPRARLRSRGRLDRGEAADAMTEVELNGQSEHSPQPQNREWSVRIRTVETHTVIVRAHSHDAAVERAKKLVKEPPNEDSPESVTGWNDRKVVKVIDTVVTGLELYS